MLPRRASICGRLTSDLLSTLLEFGIATLDGADRRRNVQFWPVSTFGSANDMSAGRLKERIFIKLVTSDRILKQSRECSQ